MLCPYAYGTVGSRVTCRSGVRKPNRMEVGRRPRRYSLQRSTDTRRAARGDLRRIACGFISIGNALFLVYVVAPSSGRDELSQLRDLEARQSRFDREYWRFRGCASAIRAYFATRTLGSSISRRSTRRRLSRNCTRVHADGSFARNTLPHRRDSRQQQSHPRIAIGQFYCSTRVGSSASGRPSVATDTEAGSHAAGPQCQQQVAFVAAKLRRVEWPTAANRSSNEQTCSSVALSEQIASPLSIAILVMRGAYAAAHMRRTAS
jgi:hypothetical protein